MKYEIIPHVGVGPIRFGMTIEDVRALFQDKPRSFKKSEDSRWETDAYFGCVHVFYRTPGMCTAVEMYRPASPFVGDRFFVGVPFGEVATWIKRQDPAATVTEVGMKSKGLGITIYAPGHHEDPKTLIEAVLAFEEGYYEHDYRT